VTLRKACRLKINNVKKQLTAATIKKRNEDYCKDVQELPENYQLLAAATIQLDGQHVSWLSS
jgi:hypothetical protein